MANTTGKKFGGRKKGTPNKISLFVKDAVLVVFEQLGGIDAMAECVQEHLTKFYRIYAKQLPQSSCVAVNQGLAYEDYLESLPPPPHRKFGFDEQDGDEDEIDLETLNPKH